MVMGITSKFEHKHTHSRSGVQNVLKHGKVVTECIMSMLSWFSSSDGSGCCRSPFFFVFAHGMPIMIIYCPKIYPDSAQLAGFPLSSIKFCLLPHALW